MCGCGSAAALGRWKQLPARQGDCSRVPAEPQTVGSHRARMRPALMLSGEDHRIVNDASCQGFNLIFISNLISSGHVCNAVLGHWLSKDRG